MPGHYNPLLVVLSLVIATLAAFVALDLSGRVYRQTESRKRFAWLAAGSGSMGLGIWSMHYIGMLAFETPMPVLYDLPTVQLSMLAALLASAVALSLAARPALSWVSTTAGAAVMGAAIASMHYIGMASMRMPVSIRYSPKLVFLSVAAAVGISFVALRLTFNLRDAGERWTLRKVASGVLMGLAIPTMHYIGMAAAQEGGGPGRFRAADLRHAVSIDALGMTCIVLVSLFVPLVALLSASIDRRVSRFQSTLHGTTRSYADLKSHHERLQGAFRAGGFGLWECDLATGLFYVDASLRDLFGVPHDGAPIPRDVWKQRVHAEDEAEMERHWRRCLMAGDRYENEYRIMRDAQDIRRVRSVASLMRDGSGKPLRALGMTWDVTAERMREQEIRDQATRFRLTLNAIGDAVIATEDDSRVVFINPAASKLTGWEASEAVGRPLSEVFRVYDEHSGQLRSDPAQRCYQHGGSFLSEDGVLHSRQGRRYNIRKHVALMGEGRAAVVTFQDTTESRSLANELLYAATHDPLTGLSNRAAFEKKLWTLWEENRYSARVHCLCIVDLDRFKIINDASGHIAGDAMLKEIASLLRRHLRATDVAARMGGDEFMLLLVDTTVEQAGEILESVLAAVRGMRFHWQGKVYDLTASLGLVGFDCFSPAPEVLLSQADAATFTAKRKGRDQIAVYREEGSAASDLLETQVAADLRRSLEENRFELHAQPIVRTSSAEPARYFEVLLRMRGQDGQLLSPDVFIPAAERFGMMSMIDRWVIRNTLSLYQEFGAARTGCRVAINLSGESLSDATLWIFVSEELTRTGVGAEALTFELTETGIIRDIDAAKQFITSCRSAGSRVALDDFGTGLSSLSYLKQFPLDSIKIDGVFIETLLNDALDRTIIRSISEIARSMGAETVAECVEDEATLAVLKLLQVDWIQGWFSGKPEPFAKVLQRLARSTETGVSQRDLLFVAPSTPMSDPVQAVQVRGSASSVLA